MKRKILAWLMTFMLIFNMVVPCAVYAEDMPVGDNINYSADEDNATNNNVTNNDDDVIDVGGTSSAGVLAGDDEQSGNQDENPVIEASGLEGSGIKETGIEETGTEETVIDANSFAEYAGKAMRTAVSTQSTDYKIICVSSGMPASLNNVTISGATVSSHTSATVSTGNYKYDVVLDGSTAMDAELTLKPSGIVAQNPMFDQGLTFNGVSCGQIASATSVKLTLSGGKATGVFVANTLMGAATHTFNFSVESAMGVSLDGTPKIGQAYTATKIGMDSVSGETYQWYRVSGETETVIEGATAATYTPVKADYNCKLKVVVTLSDQTVLTATSAEAVAHDMTISLSDTPMLGQVLTVTKDNMDDVTGETYQWYRVSGTTETAIEGATGSAYTPVKADYDCKLKVVVTLDFTTLTATTVNVVSHDLAVALADTPKLGQSYTVTKANMDDVSGETYQWYRVDGTTETVIEGATSASYTPVLADYGCKLKVVVTLDYTTLTATSVEAVTYNKDISEVQANATVTADDSEANIILRKADGTVVAKGKGSVSAKIIIKETYEYYVYKTGYSAVVESLQSTGNDVTVSNVKLTACNINDADVWASFRGNSSNMAVVTAKTPTAENVLEKWSYKSKINPVYCTPPMLMGDSIVVAYGTSIEKVDKETGKIEASGTMQAASQWTQCPPAYGDGRIYFAQMGGRMEAFDAVTLKSLWKYTNKGGGQDSSPILYNDGYVYTGYWSGDNSEFVCIDAVTGEEIWTNKVKEGFYWAGPVVVGDAVIVGSETGTVYAWNRLTGEAIGTLEAGSRICSTMAYDATGGRVYFTTNAVDANTGKVTGTANLCSMAVNAATGAMSDLKKVALTTYGTNCTSTPVVCGGYVYLTVGDGYANGYFVVAKADTLEIVNSVKMSTHSKTSPLLSTAYVQTDGYLYFYTVNYKSPGDIELTKVKAENITSSALLRLSNRQYAMNSVLCGADGTLYLKNDSGYIFAIESTQAYLTKLEAGVGAFDKELTIKNREFELVVPVKTAKVVLELAATEGATIDVNGTAVTDGRYTAKLTNGETRLAINVSTGDYTRKYTVDIRTASTDTGLHVATSASNGIANQYQAVTAYSDYAFVVTGATADKRIWYGPDDSQAKAAAPVFLLGTSKYVTGMGTKYNNTIKYTDRIYDAGTTFPLITKTTVTAESGATKDYYILAIEDAEYDGTTYCCDLTLDRSDLRITETGSTKLDAVVKYVGANAPDITWTSDDEGVATVATDGTVSAVAKGTTVITATAGACKAQCTVDVNDYIGVYMTYTDGDFVIGQDGTELYSVLVDVAPDGDGKYTVEQAFKALHKQFCKDADGYNATNGFINRFWGEDTSDISYLVNDGDRDGLLSVNDEIVNNDRINVFKYQDTAGWAYSDLYTYFDSRTDTATVGTAKTFTVKGYNVMNRFAAAPENATVTVYDADGMEVDELATTVGENGSFKLKFAAAGTYTVEVSGKAAYAGNTYSGYTEYTDATVVPARCTVTVSAASGGGGSGSGSTTSNISVKFRLIGSTLSAGGVDLSAGVDDAEYVTWIATKTYSMPKGSNTLDLFEKALKDAGLDYDVASSGWLNYVMAPRSCGGYKLENMTNGDRSGWMYTLNGTHEQATLGNSTLQNGDSFIVHYVNDYLYEDSQWATGCLGTSAQKDRWLQAKDVDPVGGSGSGSSSGNTIVSTTVTPVVVPDDKGEAKVSLTSSELRIIISEAKDAGAGEIVVAPKISGSADKVTVNIPAISAKNIGKDLAANLRVKTGLADVTIGADDLQNIGTGGSLSVTTEKRDDNSIEIVVTTNSKAVKLADTTVTIPVENATVSDVLVVVNPDGSEQVVRKCMVDEAGVVALIDGGCTLKVVSREVAFDDLNKHWGRESAEFVAARNIFNGTGENQFAPNDKMSRAMAATVLYRLENEPETSAKLIFKDGIDDWAKEAVIWAADKNIIGGDENGNYNGSAPVTRQELAAMIYRYADMAGMDTAQGGMAIREFSDWEQISEWAMSAMQWAVACGLIQGNEDGTINPTGTATRAEVATVIKRLVELGIK